MTTLSYLDNHTYKTAIAMNNIGVSLLRRGYFESAQQVLRDAISIVGVLFQLPNVDNKASLSVNEINEMFSIACQDLACSVQRPADRFMLSSNKTFEVEVLTVDESSLLSSNKNFWSEISPNRILAVQIEPHNFCDISVDAGIIMSNFACSYKVLATSSRHNPEYALRMMENSTSLWKMAYGVLAKRIEGADAISNDLLQRIVEASLLCLHNLVGALIDLQRDGELREFGMIFGTLQSFISEHNRGCGFVNISTQPAAAA